MVFAGEPFAYELDFSTGQPTGAVVYSVLGNDNNPITGLDSVSVTPDTGAISHLIVVPGTANTVSTPLFEQRTLTWSYNTDGGVVTGRKRYRVENTVPFPVSPEGVRNKLGILEHEVKDNQIDLLKAYAIFADRTTLGDLASYQGAGNLEEMRIADAIEALAALRLLNVLQVAIAKSEDSGTNAYSRYATIDWESIRLDLEKLVVEGANLVVPPTNDIAGLTIFFAVQRDDPYAGAGG